MLKMRYRFTGDLEQIGLASGDAVALDYFWNIEYSRAYFCRLKTVSSQVDKRHDRESDLLKVNRRVVSGNESRVFQPSHTFSHSGCRQANRLPNLSERQPRVFL